MRDTLWEKRISYNLWDIMLSKACFKWIVYVQKALPNLFLTKEGWIYSKNFMLLNIYLISQGKQHLPDICVYICMKFHFRFKSHFKRLVFLTSLLATLVDIVHLYETDEARMGRPYIKNFSLSLITSSWWVQVHW